MLCVVRMLCTKLIWFNLYAIIKDRIKIVWDYFQRWRKNSHIHGWHSHVKLIILPLKTSVYLSHKPHVSTHSNLTLTRGACWSFHHFPREPCKTQNVFSRSHVKIAMIRTKCPILRYFWCYILLKTAPCSYKWTTLVNQAINFWYIQIWGEPWQQKPWQHTFNRFEVLWQLIQET